MTETAVSTGEEIPAGLIPDISVWGNDNDSRFPYVVGIDAWKLAGVMAHCGMSGDEIVKSELHVFYPGSDAIRKRLRLDGPNEHVFHFGMDDALVTRNGILENISALESEFGSVMAREPLESDQTLQDYLQSGAETPEEYADDVMASLLRDQFVQACVGYFSEFTRHRRFAQRQAETKAEENIWSRANRVLSTRLKVSGTAAALGALAFVQKEMVPTFVFWGGSVANYALWPVGKSIVEAWSSGNTEGKAIVDYAKLKAETEVEARQVLTFTPNPNYRAV